MDGICLGCLRCSLLIMVFIVLFSSTNGCVRDSDCGKGRHCCKSHCTSWRIDCKKICFRDQECSRDHLCTQNMCVQCSKRYNCELKSCFNDSDCPTSLRCNTANHMCAKEKPPKQSLTLLPFVIIIAVLGFALLVLCYTEGCWREILVYLKRYFGRYGRIARDEHEADQRELGHSERGSRHAHTHKSSVDLHRIEEAMSNHVSSEHTNPQVTRSNSNSPTTVRNIQVVCHNNETRTTITRTPVTSSTSSACQQHVENDSVNPGCSPALSGSNPSQLPPNYHSLYSEVDDFEEPPPKYDDVVMKNGNAIPVCIEMQAMRPGILTPNRDHDVETTV